MGHFQVFTDAELASIRRGGKILAACLQMLRGEVHEGITTGELDRIAEKFILDEGGIPAFKGYHTFPATLCTSVNEECVHGIPGKRVLADGDIVALDCGVIMDGLYTDACISVAVGAVSPDAAKLLKVTEEALERAVSVVHAGAKVGDISGTIQEYVQSHGCSCVDALTGHGLGTTLHQFPDIPNVGRKGTGPVLPVGALIAVEPIVALGKGRIHQEDDGWTIRTSDRSLAAHFEHTLLVTEGGCEVIA
ncbi:type I methionyl aminopeptidase [Candidatus Peregrinibacteria bacterium]|nr:type I methionyl aminopeptidase [Candidatus Peregrinibacteria bacterium]